MNETDERPIRTEIPAVEHVFEHFAALLGDDYDAYRGHVYRVIHFFELFSSQPLTEDPSLEQTVALAGVFHDIGIWTDKTFDYLAPSVAHLDGYLRERDVDGTFEELRLMIENHHKVFPYRGDFAETVESFRRADWCDVSLGKLRFGLPRRQVKPILQAFPNSGFHRLLMRLTLDHLKSNPLRPAPMFRW